MLSHKTALVSLAAFLPLTVSAVASAQDVKTNEVKKELTDVKLEAPPPSGVVASLRGDATFSLTDTQKVVGQADGSTMNFGVKVDGHVDVIEGAHEWRNSLLINAGITRTPTIPEFVKNTDSLQVESIYLYHVKPWIGPFARFKLDTPMFAGTDVRPSATNYKITLQDGTTSETCPPDPANPGQCATTRLALTDGFQPLTMKESVGVFAQPYKSDPVTIEARVGLGGQQILADKQFAVADVADAPDNCPDATDPTVKSSIACVEVNQLSDVLQVGLEANLEIWGALYDNKINYKIYGGILAPFAHGDLPQLYLDAGGKDDVGQLTNIDVGANISLKIVEWASLTYEFKAVRVPQLLLDTFQVRNTLSFTMGLGIDNKPAPPPAPPGAPAAAPAPAK